MRDEKGRFTSEGMKGAKNPKWNEEVGYFALHQWVNREKGKATLCVDCGSSYWVQWANISGKYKRDLNDWKSLCSPCHRKFDGITKLSKQDAQEIKRMYISGIRQKILANQYGVDQGTISNIVNNKIQYYA